MNSMINQEEYENCFSSVMDINFAEVSKICSFSTKESLRDIVTNVDRLIEQRIMRSLEKSNFKIFGEEYIGDDRLPEGDFFWAIDPIDGTVNFLNDLHYYALSVGLCRFKVGSDLESEIGTVYLPKLNKVFYNLDRDKALCGGKKIFCKDSLLKDSLVTACFSGKKGEETLRSKQYQVFGLVNDSSRGCLRLGSAASQICFTAEGKFQATYGFGAKIWDVAGAFAIARASGCHVLSNVNSDHTVDFIVGGPTVVGELVKLFGEANLWRN